MVRKLLWAMTLGAGCALAACSDDDAQQSGGVDAGSGGQAGTPSGGGSTSGGAGGDAAGGSGGAGGTESGGSGGDAGDGGSGGAGAGGAGGGSGGAGGSGAGGSAIEDPDAGAPDAAAAPDAGADAGSDAGVDSGPEPACLGPEDCSDGNDCTDDVCDPELGCSNPNLTAGAACGDPAASECNGADTCDGAGVCLPNLAALDAPCGAPVTDQCLVASSCNAVGECSPNVAASGTRCVFDPVTTRQGSCEAGACDCATFRLTTAPAIYDWETIANDGDVNVLDYSCEIGCSGIPDHVAVFTAPQTGTYRIDSSAFALDEPTGDSRLVVLEGDCADIGSELACNDDVSAENFDSQIDIALTAGQVVTILTSEGCESLGGNGHVEISLL